MRHQWRILLLRSYSRSHIRPPAIPTSHHFQVHSIPANTSSSTHHTISPRLHFYPTNFDSFNIRSFSSQPVLEDKKPVESSVVSDIFTKFTDFDEISKELESNGVVFSHEMVLNVLKGFESSPDLARRFFDWVRERESERLNSKCYNLMLRILGSNGFVEEFWVMVDGMKRMGYGVSAHVRNKMVQVFEGSESDLERLKGVFEKGSIDKSMEKVGSRMCKVIRSEVWGDEVERRLRDMNALFSSDLVRFVVENLGDEPSKALIYFRWVEECGLVKHDEVSYNSMARVLGREDTVDRFWNVVDEMRRKGFEMDEETYVKVLGRFCKRKMIKDAVNLYEFAMAGKNKPSVSCFTFLLRKIVVSKQLDLKLVSKVVKVFSGNGNVVADPMLKSVLKAMASVGKFGECNKILTVMQKNGIVAGDNVKNKIVFGLSSTGKNNELHEFMENEEASGSELGQKTWVSLIEGHCAAEDLDKASDCFLTMVKKEGALSASHAFEVLVNAYCSKKRAIDACKLTQDCAREYGLKPWRTTYNELIIKLLLQGGFKDALPLLDLMRSHGFPPIVDPFIKYLSKSGTADEAIDFLKAMTSKKYPSTTVFLHLFESLFKAKRRNQAQDLLSKCPGYIRNHPDVLNLFCPQKPQKPGRDSSAAAVAA